MSSMCGIRQVESQVGACYVTQFSYKLKSPLIQLFDKGGLLCSLVSRTTEWR